MADVATLNLEVKSDSGKQASGELKTFEKSASAADRAAFGVAEELRDQGLSVMQHCGGGSFKAQMKKADASGAALAVIIGEDEAANNEVSVKHLRQEREQLRVARATLPDSVTNLLFLKEY